MKTYTPISIRMVNVLPAPSGGARGWQHWTPYAAVAWSLTYTVMGIYWAVSGHGFPYIPDAIPSGMAPLVGRFGSVAAWIIVTMAGIPAAIVGVAMLHGVQNRILRPLFITAGALLAGTLLLLMTSLNLLVNLGYIPFGIYSLLTGAAFGLAYLKELAQWTTIHQWLCLIGGFLWLATTVSYSRRSGGACLYCGRGDRSEGWQSPDKAARWGRIAVCVAMVVPVLYALTRYAWALGIPLGMSEAYLRSGQERGMWTSGLFLANFGLVGAVLMLGLVQRWGEVFPRWIIGLAGCRVPIALAVIPASFVSVLLIVGGIALWSSLDQMVTALASSGAVGTGLVAGILFQVGPTLLFPVWGAALALATLAYNYRRRGSCGMCGRDSSGEVGKSVRENIPSHS